MENVSVFNDHGVRYITSGERSTEWLWMEDMPEKWENKC